MAPSNADAGAGSLTSSGGMSQGRQRWTAVLAGTKAKSVAAIAGTVR